MEYEFSLCYRPGKKNGNADALSRLESEVMFTAEFDEIMPQGYDEISVDIIKTPLRSKSDQNFKATSKQLTRCAKFKIIDNKLQYKRSL